MRKNIYILTFFLALALWIYFPLFGQFFQQDEWATFAEIYSMGYKHYVLRALIPDPGHYVPLAKILLAVLFKLFQFDYWKWVGMSIIWHTFNSYLVYLLSKKIFKYGWQATFSGILFLCFAAGQQATSWVVANGITQGATTLVLFSIIYYFKNKTLICILTLLLSILFKEISVGMFIFFPIMIIVQNYASKKKILDKKIIYFIAVATLYFIFRYLTFLGVFSDIKAPIVTQSQTKIEILSNIVTFPIKGVSQTIVPSYLLLNTSKFIADKLPDGIAGTPGTNFFDNFYLKHVFGNLGLLVFVVFFTILILVAKFKKEKLAAVAFFGFLFTAINSAIYALSPGRSGFIPIIDSRNLYLPSIGTAFSLVSIGSVLKNWKWSALILICFAIINIGITRQEISNISTVGKNRFNILDQISKDNIKLNNRQVFYIESNTSYYGLPDEVRILPFQSGFGQTLLVWLNRTENFPKRFFENEFLWPIDSQGYKEIDNRGFGYIRDYDLLRTTVKEYNLPIESVVAYFWDGKKEKLTNKTNEIRLKLKSD